MQNNSGLKKVLRISTIYEFLQIFCGRDFAIRKLISMINFNPSKSSSLLDLGCGPGTLKKFLPKNIRYVGIDLEENYVNHAKLSYPDSEFYLGGIQEINNIIPSHSRFDFILAIGLFHHVNDTTASACFEAIKKYAKTGTFIVIFEPCFINKQGFISKKIMALDRGQCIRNYDEWVKLVATSFPQVSHSLCRFYRIPYVHIALTIKC